MALCPRHAVVSAWLHDPSGCHPAISDKLTGPGDCYVSYASCLLFDGGFSMGVGTSFFRDLDSSENERWLIGIIHWGPGRNQGPIQAGLSRGVELLYRTMGGTMVDGSDRTAALKLSLEFDAGRRSWENWPVRQRLLASELALRVEALVHPVEAARKLAALSESAKATSPTISQQSLIAAIELYRRFNHKRRADQLWEGGRLVFDSPENPTDGEEFWKTKPR